MNNSVTFNSELSKFGIGLFETIKVENGNVKYLDLHINRIFRSIIELKLDVSYTEIYIKDIILKYILDNKITNKALRITIFDEGYNISTRDIVYDDDMYNKGFKLMISPIKRGDSIIYRHKTTSYFENIYTIKQANLNGFDDGIFLNLEDTILECSVSNIYFIKNKIVYTPKSTLPILNGITKKRITTLCAELNIEVIESDIKITEISDFEACFVSNSLMDIMKVIQIETVKFNPNNNIFNELWRIIKC